MYKVVTTILFFCISFDVISQSMVDTLGQDQILDQVVVTAQFAPTDLRQSVNTVKIIDRQTIELRGAANLSELLQSESNMRLSNDAVLGVALSLNGIRGENVKILIDGVPMVGRIQGNLDLNQIPLTDIQRIEIVEGAQSLIYGSDASGGVINLITKKSQLSSFNGNVNAIYEQNGFKNLNTQLGFQKGKWFVNGTANKQMFDPAPDSIGKREQYWNPKDQTSARATIRYKWNDNTDLRLSGGFLNETITDLGELRRLQFKPYAFDDIYRISRSDVNLFFQTAKPKQYISQVSVRASMYDRIENAYRYESIPDTSALIPMLQDTNLSSGLSARWTYATDKTSKPINYLVGAEWNSEYGEGNRLADTSRTDQNKVSIYEVGVFGSVRWTPNKSWIVQGGSRWVIHQRFGNAFLPSIWAAFNPADKPFSIKTSVALGYRSPSLEELYFRFVDINHNVVGNVGLQPEKSVNLKTELAYKPKKVGKWQMDARISGFYNDIKNRIILASTGPIAFEYRNLEEWQSLGGNISLSANRNNRLEFKTSIQRAGYYNPLASTNAEVPTFGWSVDWSNELTLHILKDQLLSFNIWHKHTGDTPFFYNDKEGKLQQDVLGSWQFANASFSTRIFNKKLFIQAGAKNLTDVKQRNNALNSANHTDIGNQGNLHWGRTWFVNTSFSF